MRGNAPRRARSPWASRRAGAWAVTAVLGFTGAAAGILIGAPAGAQSEGCPTTTTSFGCTDLSVTKSDSPDPVYEGDLLTYTMLVRNNGPEPAFGVYLHDNLPNSVEFVSVTTSRGSCEVEDGTVTCFIGTLCGPGECEGVTTASVTITVRPLRPGTVTNTARVNDTGSSDPDKSNNKASATTTVRPAFALALSPASATNPVGSQHTVTATLTRKGQPDPNRQISFAATGANQASGTDTTDSAGRATFTYTGGNTGQDTIKACYETPSNPNPCSVSDTVTKSWTAYTLSIGGATTPGTQNVTHTVVAHVRNNGQDINGRTVLFSVSGANSASGSDVSGPHGKADFTYPGRQAGDDTIVACLDLNANGQCNTPAEPTASIAYTWQAQCRNGVDDDHDGLTDHPADPGASPPATRPSRTRASAPTASTTTATAGSTSRTIQAARRATIPPRSSTTLKSGPAAAVAAAAPRTAPRACHRPAACPWSCPPTP